MMRLYRGAETSPLLHPIDARGWIAAGWTETPIEETSHAEREGLREKEETSKGQQVETEPQDARESRELELLGIYEVDGWRGLKAIAEPLGIEKPADGWDEAIPLILEKEGF
jgi:hypothetical protein